MSGLFDDLIPAQPPQQQASAGLFDDLIPEQSKAAPPEPRGDILDPIAQGMTLGFGDEIAAGINGIASSVGGALGVNLGGDADSFSEGYNARLGKLRGDLDAYRERRPATAMAAEFAGAVPTAFVPGAAAARGASLVGSVGRGAATGLAAGAIQGFGSGEGGALPRAGNAAVGAGLGAGIGAALPLAGAGIAAGARGVRDMVAPNALTQQGIGRGAQAALVDALRRDGMTFAEAGKRADDFGADAMLADTSPALRNKADVLVANDRPGAREYLTQALRERAEGRRDAAGSLFDDVLGPQPHMPTLERDAIKAQRATAERNYEAAKAANAGRPVNTEALLQNIANDLEVPYEALSRGTAQMRDLPENRVAREFASRLETEGGGQITDFDRLSRVQQAVYGQARSLLGSADGQQRYAGAQLMRYHDQLVASMDEASDGLFSAARGAYAQDAAVRDAHQRGRGVFGPSEHPQYLAEEAAKMSDPAYDMLLASTRDEARRVMSSSRGDLSAVSALASPGSSMRENLAAVLMRQGPAGEAQLQKITERARGEVEKRLTERIGGNSRTQPRMSDPDAGPQKVPLDVGITGLGLRAAQSVVDTVFPDLAAGRSRGLAKALGAQGADRKALVKLLTEAEVKRNKQLSARQRALVSALLTQRAPIALSGSGLPGQLLLGN